MALYNVTNQNAPFSAVEFKPVSDGNLSFFYIRNPEHAADTIHWITSSEIGQRIVSQAQLANGQTALIMRGSKSAEEIEQALGSRNITLQPVEKKRKFNAWAFRGNMSNIGQGLQLYSSLSSGKLKPDLAAFSLLNLTANFIDIKYGGQKEKDKYQLLDIKQNVNKLLAANLPEGAALPDVNEMHSLQRKEPEPPPTLGKRFNDFMTRNSVRFGEIGLRYLGSLAMVFPVDKWKNIMPALKQGGAGSAFQASLNTNKPRLYTGITYLIGKTVAFFSKTPDPYNPKPSSALDRIREKYFFKTSSVIETGAAAILASGAFSGDFGKKKPDRSDLISGVGGSLFTVGLTTRLFAPFGQKNLNVEEAFAYTSDALAKTPPEKLPQMLAQSAGLLQKYMGETQDFGDIYTRLLVDLYRYHNISIDGINTASPETLTKPVANIDKTPEISSKEKQTFLNSSSELLKKAPVHTLGFATGEQLGQEHSASKTV